MILLPDIVPERRRPRRNDGPAPASPPPLYVMDGGKADAALQKPRASPYAFSVRTVLYQALRRTRRTRATAPEAERLYAEGYVAQQKFATRPFWLRLNCLVRSALHIICFHFM
jgi:hypothetical protein